ncbi:hypothetical protein TrCOL_g3140, partial [Triparma columacea]
MQAFATRAKNTCKEDEHTLKSLLEYQATLRTKATKGKDIDHDSLDKILDISRQRAEFKFICPPFLLVMALRCCDALTTELQYRDLDLATALNIDIDGEFDEFIEIDEEEEEEVDANLSDSESDDDSDDSNDSDDSGDSDDSDDSADDEEDEGGVPVLSYS